MNVDCFDRIINIIATIGTAGSAIAAVWLGLRGDRCRVDGIFLWDGSTEYKPILWIRNISNRIAVLKYVEIYYDRILKKRLDFSKEYSIKNYAIVRANDTVEIPIDSMYLEVDESRYRDKESEKHQLKFKIKLRKGGKLTLKQELSYEELKNLLFCEVLF